MSESRRLVVVLARWLPAALAAATLAVIGPDPRAAHVVSRQAYLMGTRVTLTTLDRDRTRGIRRLESLLRILEDTEAELSTWRDDSVLSRLNRRPVGVSLRLPESTCRLLAEVQAWTIRTGRTFDPAIGALLAAWDVQGQGRVPSEAELTRALSQSGWSRLELDAARCEVLRLHDVTLDAGAFGKGAALDRARATDRQQPWYIDLGGQVAVGGTVHPEGGWDVDIAHPVRRDQPLFSVRLRQGSLATSGGSERDRQAGGTRVGHILDPRTGRPAAFAGSVLAWSEDALAADVLSTALYVMGPGTGLAWAAANDVAACYLTVEDGAPARRCTPAFSEEFGRDGRARPTS